MLIMFGMLERMDACKNGIEALGQYDVIMYKLWSHTGPTDLNRYMELA